MRLNFKGLLIGMFRRPKVIFIASFAAILFFLVLSALIFSDYVARAKILVTDTTMGVPKDTNDKISDRALRTTAEVLRSRFLMEEVVKELNLEDAFGKEDAVEKLLSIVNIKPAKGMDIIEISVKLKKPELAAHIADTICKVVITNSIKDRFSLDKDLLSWLKEESAGIRSELSKSADRLREFKNSTGVVDLPAEHDAMQTRIEGLNNNLSLARAEREKAEVSYGQIRQYLESGVELNKIPYIENSSDYKNMQVQIEAYKKTEAELLSKYQPSHPSVVEIDGKLSKLELDMNAYAKNIIDGIKQGYEASRSQEESLGKLIKEETDKMLALEEKLDEYNSLADDLKEKETAYNTFLKRIEDGFGTAVLRIRQIELLEPAYLPRKKDSPALFYIILAGLFVGLITGGMYNILKGEKVPTPKKEETPAVKDKGMYIERVKE